MAAFAALPASAGSMATVRVSTVGKSPEQLAVDIVQAAKKVCRRANAGATFEDASVRACVQASVRDSVAQAKLPALSEISTTRLAMN
ncbi:hypothetical protein DJ018_18230 [Phenylobacterium deserti]|uniref:UrcA family protein n=1 Tax=Phenylobacterium deserti TaxID=1914756 RepID=A0A328A853_9CAUL|nr:hypothetical protein DJ018_18230 [Phenylobacterium deserti]